MPRDKGKIIVATSLAVLLLDQLSKFLIRKFFYPGESLPILDNIFSLTFVKNRGAAFGMLHGFSFIFIIIAVFVIGYIFHAIFIRRNLNVNPIILGLFLAGTAGNLIDRIYFGYVIDFIDFHIWPVFNIADSAITISVAWFILSMLKDSKKEKNVSNSI